MTRRQSRSAKAQKAALTWTKDLKREQIIFIVATSFLDAATRAERLRLDTRRVELCEQRLANIQQQVQLGLKLPDRPRSRQSAAHVEPATAAAFESAETRPPGCIWRP